MLNIIASVVAVMLLSLTALMHAADPYDDVKRDLVVAQFRTKLLQQLSQFSTASVLTGASHGGRNKFRNPNKPLDKVHGISIVLDDPSPIISKMIIPGINVTDEQSDKGQSFEFKLSKLITRGRIKSAKLFIYVDNPGEGIRSWRIDIVNSTTTISKTCRSLSRSKLQHFFVSDIVKAFLANHQRIPERPSLTLRLFDHKNRGMKIKSIMLMVSVKNTPTRTRRSTEPYEQNWCTKSSIFCCMMSFSVHPSQIYFQNLISPDVIHLNYCKGDCNYYTRGKSNYAKALGLLQKSKIAPMSARQLESIKSCCAPQSYSRIRIKYQDDQTQEFVERIAHDMVVSSCGCY